MRKLNLAEEKIGRLLATFAIPCIISMLINSVYNIVDQIFIGQGVGYLGNAATNVIFPLVIICNALASLIGNGCAASLSLRLGEGKSKEAKKSVGSSIVTLIIVAVGFTVISFLLLDKLIYAFGCTDTVFPYAMNYGKIILIGAPFMIIYTGLSSIIRADGSPRYSMVCLLVGAVLNIILDPILIFKFNMGVQGGALATIIGQIISFIIAVIYIPRIKSVKLERRDFSIDKDMLKILGYGASSFITQMTVLALFIFMNNIMTKYGSTSEYGADIPLSVYGIISKLNGLYVSAVLGIAIGAQPIIGFNYGAGKYDRVRETLRKVIIINFIIGIIFNLAMVIFPTQLISIFGSSDDSMYLKFATDSCRIFLMLSALNAFEMSSSIVIQSLGNVKKATAVSFIRQIILFIPIALILTHIVGLYGALYAGPIADTICFICVIFIFGSEYRKIGRIGSNESSYVSNNVEGATLNKKVIITINREYGSGGRYVGKLLADKLKIKFYDRELIKLVAKEAGMSEDYIEENEQKRKWGSSLNAEYNEDDKLFIAESNAIKEIAKKESCVIIGRCADFILKDEENVCRIFIYSDEEDKINRAVKYYNIDEKEAKKKINKENKERAKHYKYYTNKVWNDLSNYNLTFDSGYLGTEKIADIIEKIVVEKYNLRS